MRGHDTQQAGLFSDRSPEARVPAAHSPVCGHGVDRVVAPAGDALSPHRPALDCSGETAPGPVPLQVWSSIRSERLVMEQLDDTLLFRGCVGLDLDAPIWDVTVFTKNRDRVLNGEVATAFFAQVLAQAKAQHLLSDAHFTVDGTLIEAWAGQKSFKKKTDATPPAPAKDPGNPSVDFRGERRTTATHASTTDPAARLYKKAAGQEATLCFVGPVLMEHRNGLVVPATVPAATGTAARDAALALVDAQTPSQRITLSGGKNYGTQAFVHDLRTRQITPPVAQHTTNRTRAIDGRTTRHPGYAISQQKRTRVEEVFGWMKTVGMLRKVKLRGIPRVGWLFTFAAAVYNLVRMRTLVEARA
jgi:hypothetical protein